MILLDTNIMICSKQSNHPDHIIVSQKLSQLVQAGESLVICPQGVYEFYVVATRPNSQRGFGFTSEQALNEIDDFQTAYTFINDPVDLFVTWQHILQQYATLGKAAHDARFVAFMKSHNIDSIYTINSSDFNRYNNIINILT